jgi:hypothetical protein
MKVLYRKCSLDLKGEPLVHRCVRGIVREKGKSMYRYGITARLPRNRVITIAWGTL